MAQLIQEIISYVTASKGVFLDITIALIILLIGFTAGKLLGRLLKKILYEAELDTVAKKMGVKLSLERKFAALAEYLIYLITIILALNQIGLTNTVLKIALASILLLLLISALISIKDFLPNSIAAFFIHKKRMLKKGDDIKVQGIQGKIQKIGLVETHIITKNKDSIYIPNSALIKSKLEVKKH